MNLKNTVRNYVLENVLDGQEVHEAIEYLKVVHDVILNLKPLLTFDEAYQELGDEPTGERAGPSSSGSIGWEDANRNYRNALRVRAVTSPFAYADVLPGHIEVYGFDPELYVIAWLDPRKLTDAQAESLGVLPPTIQALPTNPLGVAGTPTPAPEPVVTETPEEKAERKAKLKAMVARDNARLSPGRRFHKSSAAQLLSEGE